MDVIVPIVADRALFASFVSSPDHSTVFIAGNMAASLNTIDRKLDAILAGLANDRNDVVLARADVNGLRADVQALAAKVDAMQGGPTDDDKTLDESIQQAKGMLGALNAANKKVNP